jgi:RHS repeat-associated protein
MLEEDANPFRFVGGWGVIDEGNGLSYMRARYYDQSFGRFISQDPIWNSNLYEYSANDPINFSDPSGLFLSDISTERFIKQGILAVAKYRSNSTSLRSANSLLKANKLLGKFEDAMAIYVLASKGYYSY